MELTRFETIHGAQYECRNLLGDGFELDNNLLKIRFFSSN